MTYLGFSIRKTSICLINFRSCPPPPPAPPPAPAPPPPPPPRPPPPAPPPPPTPTSKSRPKSAAANISPGKLSTLTMEFHDGAGKIIVRSQEVKRQKKQVLLPFAFGGPRGSPQLFGVGLAAVLRGSGAAGDSAHGAQRTSSQEAHRGPHPRPRFLVRRARSPL